MRQFSLLLFLIIFLASGLCDQSPNAPQVTLGPDLMNEPGGQVIIMATIEGNYDYVYWSCTSEHGTLTVLSDTLARYQANLNECDTNTEVTDTVYFYAAFQKSESNVDELVIHTRDTLPPTISRCANLNNMEVNYRADSAPIVFIDKNNIPWVIYKVKESSQSYKIKYSYYYNNAWVSATNDLVSESSFISPLDAISYSESSYIYCAYIKLGSPWNIFFKRFNISNGPGNYSQQSWNACFNDFVGDYQGQFLFDGSILHFAYKRGGNLYYRSLNGTSWGSEQLLALNIYDESHPNWTLAQNGQIWAAFSRYIYSWGVRTFDVYARAYYDNQWHNEEQWTTTIDPQWIIPIDSASSIASDCYNHVWTSYIAYLDPGLHPYNEPPRLIRRTVTSPSDDHQEIDLTSSAEGKDSAVFPLLSANFNKDALYSLYGRTVATQGIESDELFLKKSAGNAALNTWTNLSKTRITASSTNKAFGGNLSYPPTGVSISKLFDPNGIIAVNKYQIYTDSIQPGALALYRHKVEIILDNNKIVTQQSEIPVTIQLADENNAKIKITGDVRSTVGPQTLAYFREQGSVVLLSTGEGLKTLKFSFCDQHENWTPEFNISIYYNHNDNSMSDDLCVNGILTIDKDGTNIEKIKWNGDNIYMEFEGDLFQFNSILKAPQLEMRGNIKSSGNGLIFQSDNGNIIFNIGQ